MIRWWALGKQVGPDDRPAVMGILNVTPDSFADGGQLRTVAAAVAHGEKLTAEGADILDIGGESSRPGAEPISTDEELDRVVPVVEGLVRRVGTPISVDTTKATVAREAIAAGAAIVNDITGLADPAMAATVAASAAGVVIMHMQGLPPTMQVAPHYADVVAEVATHLDARVATAVAAGIDRARIAVDPGIGFGKTFDHNLALLRHLDRLGPIGCPILVGTSRKGFLGKLTGRGVADRQAASVASALAAAAAGASILRVHDVAATVDACRVWQAQVGWRPSPAPVAD